MIIAGLPFVCSPEQKFSTKFLRSHSGVLLGIKNCAGYRIAVY